MTIETQKVPFGEYYIPGHSPRERNIGKKLSSLYKGSPVWIIPLSSKYGDDITAMAMNCVSYSSSLIELAEPFRAHIEDYDGHFLRLRSDHYYCLRIDIGDLKDLIPCSEAADIT